jgi:hypothetical protein
LEILKKYQGPWEYQEFSGVLRNISGIFEFWKKKHKISGI